MKKKFAYVIMTTWKNESGDTVDEFRTAAFGTLGQARRFLLATACSTAFEFSKRGMSELYVKIFNEGDTLITGNSVDSREVVMQIARIEAPNDECITTEGFRELIEPAKKLFDI